MAKKSARKKKNIEEEKLINGRKIRRFFDYCSCVLIVFLILVGIGIMISYVENPWGIKVYSVLSDSMSPSIGRGSLIFTAPQNNYEKGDVITFKPASGRLGGVEVDTVTHRIDKVTEANGTQIFMTKGDANPGPDVERVTDSNVVGKVFLSIPLIGFPIEFAKSEIGLILLVIIPAVIITYEELRKIIRSIDLKKMRLKLYEN